MLKFTPKTVLVIINPTTIPTILILNIIIILMLLISRTKARSLRHLRAISCKILNPMMYFSYHHRYIIIIIIVIILTYMIIILSLWIIIKHEKYSAL